MNAVLQNAYFSQAYLDDVVVHLENMNEHLLH